MLTSVTPRGGAAGSVVVVHGTNLFSPNGVVLARVDGQPTQTDCPSRTACQVTIPQLAGSHAVVPVTITTAIATSNAIYLHYR